MVFGKKRTHEQQDSEVYDVDDVEHVSETQFPHTQSETQPQVSSQKDESETKPLLDEVTFVGAANCKNAGGAKVWVCKHCKLKFTSSYLRIHTHFFGTQPGKKAEIRRCNALLADREKYTMLLNKVKNAEKVGVSKSLKNYVISKKQNTSSKSPLEQSFGVMERNAVDLKIMRCLCANGILFNVLQNPQFQEMVSAIQKGPPGYKAPSSEKVRTTLLDACKSEVEKDMSPIKDTWFTHGVSVVSDGWSNVKHNPLINVLAVNSRGATFMYADDFSGVEKIGDAIAKFFIGAIESIRPSNVLQVVTDNAANCKAAGKEIEKPSFSNFSIQFKSSVVESCKDRIHNSLYIVERLKDCREALATTIALNAWREWVKQGDENIRKIGQEVVDTVNSESFWDDIDQILAITKPIFLLIKFCDGEGPKMGEIYERMDNMLGEIKDVMKDNVYGVYYPEVESIILSRWEKMTIPLHCLGFALTPRFYDTSYLEKLAPGGIARKAPNLDKEVMMGVMKSFERIAEKQEEERMLREQFASFTLKNGMYSYPAAQVDAVTMDPIDWWSNIWFRNSGIS